MPDGFECQIRPRSGLALRHGITLPNTPATIDSDYRGELMVALVNLGTEPFRITRGMRIAQMIVARVERVASGRSTRLPRDRARHGGFGSSGQLAATGAHYRRAIYLQSTHVPSGSSMKVPVSESDVLLPANEIAVDLGTANTLIYVKGEGIVLNEPSVVAIEKATGKIKGVGLEAKRMLGRTPEGIIAVRPLKDGVIADFDVTEKMLRYFLKLIIDKHVFQVKPRVIVCVPSGITEVERRAVRDSAETAGAKEVFMVAEPMAAAIGVGLPVETPTGNMVIDIGGGTTEIAVIALSGIVSDTSIRTGGDELDKAIVQFMRKNYNLLIGEPTAEQIKIKIGSAAPIGDEREMEVKGRDLVSGIPKTVRVHSTEIREAIQEPIQQIVDAVRRALEITPPELASDIVDRGIVMTGGGALIRGLDILLAQETGLPIHVDEDPLTCVVRGTGRILDDDEKYRSVLSA